MMRKIAITSLLLLAACSKTEDPGSSPAAMESMSENRAGPDISMTALAGVAVSYSYRFRLPIEKVAQTQEQHAMQCEALGPTKCRIVGMEYHASEHRSINAALSVKLAPDVARRFGKQGVQTVVGNGGMLADSEITSTDAGIALRSSEQTNESLTKEKAQIQSQLAEKGLGSTERSQLQARVAALNDTARATSAQGADAALLLASTPLVFSYQSGPVDPGFSDGPIIGAIKEGWGNVVAGLAVMVTLFITLLPWVVAGGLLIWLWRRWGRKLFPSDPREP